MGKGSMIFLKKGEAGHIRFIFNPFVWASTTKILNIGWEETKMRRNLKLKYIGTL